MNLNMFRMEAVYSMPDGKFISINFRLLFLSNRRAAGRAAIISNCQRGNGIVGDRQNLGDRKKTQTVVGHADELYLC